MASIGPFWNGNEVWLIAAAAALFALFPAAYAAAFSGFYLPFIIVLWLLMLRGIALELRSISRRRFGISLGRRVRGLERALDLRVRDRIGESVARRAARRGGLLRGDVRVPAHPYALLVGVFALATLAQHGAAFAALRLDGDLACEPRECCGRFGGGLPLYLAVTAEHLRCMAGSLGGSLRCRCFRSPSLRAFGGVRDRSVRSALSQCRWPSSRRS